MAVAEASFRISILTISAGLIVDFDGNYTLNVGAGQTVEVTYVGYVTKTFKVGGQSKYDITLVEDNNSLDEVVVVGYGTMKKSDIFKILVYAIGLISP
jgi:TonB-dependent starch-binding outer membrane protein SusC